MPFGAVRMQPSGFAPSWMFDTEHIGKNRTASTSYGPLVVQDHIRQRAVDLQPAHGNEGIARGVTTQKQKEMAKEREMAQRGDGLGLGLQYPAAPPEEHQPAEARVVPSHLFLNRESL